MLRRMVDIALSFLAGIGTLPIMLAAALAVALSCGRPILFRQRRSGLNGQIFELIKFRSMTNDRDELGNLLSDAARTKGVGRFLRRSRIDELPELWNVLIGDLSLIGPRPLVPEIVSSFGPAGQRRGVIRPGLTGWAQVNGNARLATKDKLALDLWYIDNRSFCLDLRIIVLTVDFIIRGDRLNPHNIEKSRFYLIKHYGRANINKPKV